MNAGESLRDQVGRDALRPSPEVTAPGCKVAAMERREACVLSPERAPRLERCGTVVRRRKSGLPDLRNQ